MSTEQGIYSKYHIKYSSHGKCEGSTETFSTKNGNKIIIMTITVIGASLSEHHTSRSSYIQTVIESLTIDSITLSTHVTSP